MIKYASFSEAGVHNSNEDQVFVSSRDNCSLIAIADGMGGKEAGEDASRVAITTIKDAFEASSKINFPALFESIKSKIEDFSKDNNIKQMGTTVTACLIEDDRVTVGHVGDCRLYHLRNSGIISRTKDQTEVQKLLDDGILSEKRALQYPRRNILLSALTNFSDFTLFETEFSLEKGDRLILMTDGFYELVKKSEVRDVSIENKEISDAVNSLKSLIESKDIRDDYSVMACEYID